MFEGNKLTYKDKPGLFEVNQLYFMYVVQIYIIKPKFQRRSTRTADKRFKKINK